MALRVLHLTTVATPVAGAELTSVLLARELPTHGIEFEVCTLSPPGQIHDRLVALERVSSSLHAESMRSLPTVLRCLEARLRTFRPHIVHAQLFHAGIVGLVGAKRMRVPFVLTRQYVKSIESYRGQWSARIDRWVARQADEIVAISSEVKGYLERDTRLARGRVSVIHNAADVDRFRAVASAGETSEELRIVYAASLYPWKGHVHLLAAARILAKSGRRFQLQLIGDGPDRPELEALCRKYELEDHVSFLGWRDDIPALFASAHIAVHSAVDEAFGIAIAEAMAAGLPVVASDVGGIPDVVADETTGFLVPPADPRALADRLGLLIDDPMRRAAMGTAGRTRAVSVFSPRTMAEKYAALFRSIANS